MQKILLQDAGTRHLLLGNEAIARGALEAGINVVTCYPGTPSSEVPDTFRRLLYNGQHNGQHGGVRLEYSVNEKVALEVGAGAALAGAKTLVTMKHVGVNVAADPLLTAAYTGLPGGLVLLSADDPACHSSQNEQDNRYYARFASLPCFEPSTAQEAKDMTRDALNYAREWQQPVLLRTTTRLNHLRGPVDFGSLPGPAPCVPFAKTPQRFVPVPAVARQRHRILHEQLELVRAVAETSPWNRHYGKGPLGVIATGMARAYLADALYEIGLDQRVRVLELGMTWPLPTNLLTLFLKDCETVLVLEEGEALLEQDLRALVQRQGLATVIRGKDHTLTIYGEYDVSGVRQALHNLCNMPTPASLPAPLPAPLPSRPPNLCPGCSHRAVYYAVRTVFGDNAVYSSDIGCYTLGLLPPLRMADFLVCMGSSISAGGGFALASGMPVVAFIGDSTFFHTGLPGLANAIFNQHNLLLIILDNGTTAMTGHQPNPGMVQEMLGPTSQHLDMQAIVRGMGVKDLRVVKAFNLRAVTKALEEFKDSAGVRVIIAEEPCILYARRSLQKRIPKVAFVAQQNAEALACLETLACPAFVRDANGIAVDPTLCNGCMVCLQVAPTAFTAKDREKSA